MYFYRIHFLLKIKQPHEIYKSLYMVGLRCLHSISLYFKLHPIFESLKNARAFLFYFFPIADQCILSKSIHM